MNYSDVSLIPNFFGGRSRSEIDVSCYFLGRKFKLPVVPSNMSSVISMKLAKFLSFNDYFYIMHRFFKEPDDNYHLVDKMNEEHWPLISISVGVQESDKEIIRKISEKNLDVHFITIDIAHGHSKLMKNMIWIIKKYLPTTRIIAGNTCSSRGSSDLIEWGADCVKIGIAQGGACSTFGKTGFGVSMPDTIKDVYMNSEVRFPVIIDGGIRTNGDIAKAIAMLYQTKNKVRLKAPNEFIQSIPEVMVMAGSLFAACDDSPADRDDYGQKLYYGSASAKQKGHNKNVEGFEVMIRGNDMTYSEKLKEIEQDLQSAASYAGGSLFDLCQVGINLNR